MRPIARPIRESTPERGYIDIATKASQDQPIPENPLEGQSDL